MCLGALVKNGICLLKNQKTRDMKSIFKNSTKFTFILFLGLFLSSSLAQSQSLVWNYKAGDNSGYKINVSAGEKWNDAGEQIPTLKFYSASQWATWTVLEYHYFWDYDNNPTTKLKYIRAKSSSSGKIFEFNFNENNKKVEWSKPDGSSINFWLN